MKIGRRRFLKSLAFAGAITTMGLSGCVSSLEPITEPDPTPRPLAAPAHTPSPTPKQTPRPTPTSTPTPLAVEPTPTSTLTTKKFTESKRCPQCWIPTPMYLADFGGALWWVCKECSYIEIVTEPEILRKYGYIT